MFEIKDEAVATQVDVQSQTESGLCPSTHQEQDARELICANPAFKRLQNSSSVLLLQGPLGPFFDRLARWLKANGTQVNRVALHAGDLHDCKAIRPVTYKGPRDGWGEYVRQLIARHGVDCIVLFGQSRYYHVIAREVAAESGIAVVVLEEGYFRPGFITMELDGVNGYSRTLQRFRWAARVVHHLVGDLGGKLVADHRVLEPHDAAGADQHRLDRMVEVIAR